eukprot:scaffold282062_cov32-Prasinocladus_malaysianus.AAC.1
MYRYVPHGTSILRVHDTGTYGTALMAAAPHVEQRPAWLQTLKIQSLPSGSFCCRATVAFTSLSCTYYAAALTPTIIQDSRPCPHFAGAARKIRRVRLWRQYQVVQQQANKILYGSQIILLRASR